MTCDQLNEISMAMLSDAGNAKRIFTEILAGLSDDNRKTANIDEQMHLAHQWLIKAHKQQNMVIADSESVHYSVLFTHAQDTLMNTETIEFIIKRFIPILMRNK